MGDNWINGKHMTPVPFIYAPTTIVIQRLRTNNQISKLNIESNLLESMTDRDKYLRLQTSEFYIELQGHFSMSESKPPG
jgi:dephospho-CoA kinase